MTAPEYISAYLGKFGVSGDEISLLLLEQGISADYVVSGPAEAKIVKKAIYSYLPAIMAGMQNVSEGGYSVSWNFEGIKTWFTWLAADLGLNNPFAAKVSDKSNWW